MIHIGDKFKRHWVGNESCYEGRLYQVTGVIDNCRCGRPSFLTGMPENPRREHVHVSAKLIEAPYKYMIGESGFSFGPLDPDTLHYIDNPEGEWIEIVRKPGDQLSLF